MGCSITITIIPCHSVDIVATGIFTPLASVATTGSIFPLRFGGQAEVLPRYLANCVSFSKWFLNKYVSGGPYAGLGNGRDVVGGLINRKNSGFENGNHTPRAYAIFSRRSGGVVDGVSYGHTGVVLGVDMARKKIVIGEASCGASPSTIDAKEEDLEKWTSDDYSYAYTDLILKGL